MSAPDALPSSSATRLLATPRTREISEPAAAHLARITAVLHPRLNAVVIERALEGYQRPPDA